jgi:hypothetical protein
MTDSDLYSVLDRASQGIEPPMEPHHAATAALSRARTIRTRRRGLVAGGVAAVAVLAVVVATGVPGLDRSEPPIAPAPTVPAIPDSAVQPPWDPRDAKGLPQRATRLPATLQPPVDAAPLPLAGAARLVLSDSEDGLYLLAEDGTWAEGQAPSGSAYGSSLSDDGTMLADAGPRGLWVTDVRDGRWRRLALPPGPDGAWTGLDTSVQWRGSSKVVLNGGMGTARIDVDGEAAPRVDRSELAQTYGYAVAPAGEEVAFGQDGSDYVIQDLVDGESVRTFSAAALEQVWVPVATASRVAGVVAGIPRADRPTDHAGVLVLDRDRYAAAGYLPIARTTYTPGISSAGFSAGRVIPVGWLDDRTVLLNSGAGTIGKSWSLVAWDVDSGDLSLVASGGPRTQLTGVARNLVRD